MRQILIVRSAFLLILLATSPGFAQETKSPEQKPAAPVATPETEPAKNEVDQALAEAKKRGEVVLGVCLENCDESALEDSVVIKGQARYLAKPDYPALARAAHAAGTVEVQVIIDVNGKIIAAAAISGHPLLRATCVQAARSSAFEPTTVDGKPVNVTGVLQYHFVAG